MSGDPTGDSRYQSRNEHREATDERRGQVCKSWCGSEVQELAGSAGVDKRRRRHRVCKSWNGYGTLVEEDEEHSFTNNHPPTMKPPSRWSLKSRQPPPGGSSSGSDADIYSPSRVPLIHEDDTSPTTPTHVNSTSPARVPLMHDDDSYSLPKTHGDASTSRLPVKPYDVTNPSPWQLKSHIPSSKTRKNMDETNAVPWTVKTHYDTPSTSRLPLMNETNPSFWQSESSRPNTSFSAVSSFRTPFVHKDSNSQIEVNESPTPTRRPLSNRSQRHPNSLSTPSMMALLRHEILAPHSSGDKQHHGSCGSLARAAIPMRKCATLGSVEPITPRNRLRIPSESSPVCSRCSSLLSMASSSRYSLNAAGGFVAVKQPTVLCKLCLGEVPLKDTCTIKQCECIFCNDCMRCYVEFEIQEGAYDISCPDAQCSRQGVVSLTEVQQLVSEQFMEKYKRFRLNREVDMDVSRLWCPKAGCETVCNICPTGERCLPQNVRCPTCSCDFCSNCKHPWHGGITCEENTRLSNLLTKEPGIPFDNDLIKCCPMCSVPIEKDEGCAQMMCKRCKHVFCWYCLASLDDDFLLRHYDKGPCKNKLGHSRASVIWHRTQVIGIFAGFGILLLVASPLLLLAAPCIVCCKCRVCSGGGKMEAEDET